MISSLKKIFNRIPAKVTDLLFNMIVSIALVISLMPIIAWYAGLFGLACLVFQWTQYQKTNFTKIKIPSFNEIVNFKHGKKSLYIILFGILIHGSCRIHSQLLINKLYNEAIHEKNTIISNTEKK